MASNNTIKDAILTLFPDNNNKEISAADMRIFVQSIFGNKEELVSKVLDEADMKLNNSKIYEKSIVIITSAGSDSGVYISKANQPIALVQLDKVADLADGSMTPSTPISDFMIKYIHEKSYLNAEYTYLDENISNASLKNGANEIYSVDYTYTDGNISQTAIQEISADTVYIQYQYTNGNISTKTYIL